MPLECRRGTGLARAVTHRVDLEQELSAPMKADESASAFRNRYTRNLERFTKCSGTRRFTDSLRGVAETIEHILTSIGKGPLRTAVMSKLESARCKAAQRHEPPPNLDKFWSIFEYQYALIETNSARDLFIDGFGCKAQA